MNDRRILFFADASSVHTRRWVREMSARGYEAIVATRRPANVTGAKDVIALRPGSDGAGWFLALPEVRRLARRLAPRWVHGHYVTSYGLWAAASGVRPVVLTAWGSDILVTPRESAFMRRVVGWTLRRAALVTADSRDMLEEISRYKPRAVCEEVLWGADTELFRPAQGTAHDGGFEVISVRNWEPNYNIDVVLRAFAGLLKQRPGATLNLIGGGPDERALRALELQLGIGDAVRFTGRVDEHTMAAMLRRAQACISIPTSDATSVALLEAMACGLPVVASDLPANRQWLAREGGLLVNPRDSLAVTAALLRLHDARDEAAAMGQRNRAVIEQRASRRSQMDLMDRLYRSVAASAS
jgi:glycosyltransferase involved in cell wall biosynthesis